MARELVRRQVSDRIECVDRDRAGHPCVGCLDRIGDMTRSRLRTFLVSRVGLPRTEANALIADYESRHGQLPERRQAGDAFGGEI